MQKFILSITGVIFLMLIAMTIIYVQNTNELAYPMFGIPPSVNHQQDQSQPPEPEPLHRVNVDAAISYSLQNDALNITFDEGENWTKVPIEKDQLFAGEYNGNKRSLIPHSYLLTKARTAFLYAEGPSLEGQQTMKMVYTLDKGKTWEKAVVTKPFPGVRFRKVGFVNTDFGYVIISGGRTMSQEGVRVYVTRDGGEKWQQIHHPDASWLVSDGGFVSESDGFISINTSNPNEPILYVTNDGGKTWHQATFHIQKRYSPVFVVAEVPVKRKNHLEVLVNQGPNGDYQGGKVKGKFISTDQGQTWKFQEEVQPDEVE